MSSSLVTGSYQHFGYFDLSAFFGHTPFAIAFNAMIPIFLSCASASTCGPKLPAYQVQKLTGNMIVSKSKPLIKAVAASTE